MTCTNLLAWMWWRSRLKACSAPADILRNGKTVMNSPGMSDQLNDKRQIFMKRILFWSAVIALAAVSCNKIENDVTVNESNVPSFVASVDGADTKSVLDGRKSYWDGNEGIRVLDGVLSNGKVYTATAEKAEKAVFNESDATVLLGGDDWFAAYPEGPAGSVTWDGDVASPAKKFWLPATQTAVAGSYDPTTHIAVAYAEAGDYSLDFKNVTSLVKVTVANDNVSEICFYGNNQEKIAGNFDVLYNEGEPVASFATGYTQEGYAKITGNIENGATYYISILPTHFANGFSIEFVVDGAKYTKKLSSEYTVKRNQIINLPVVTFETVEVETKTVYMRPSSSWVGMGGRYAAYCWGTDAAAVWYDMTDSDGDGVYEVEIPVIFENIIFCSMGAGNSTNDWNNKLAQTPDLTIPSDDVNCYVVHAAEWMTVENAKAYEEPAVVEGNQIYLKPNSNWTQSNARFAVYSWDGGDQWFDMTDSDSDGIYEVVLPKSISNIIFCRMNPGTTANNWNNKWNQTSDLTVPTDGTNLYTVKSGTWDKGGGTWSTK